jgi:hypothetical protein
MSRYTSFARSLIKTAAFLGSIVLAATSAAPALAASGPSQVLYIFPGAFDNGGTTSTGVATIIHCFNFSPSTETIQYIVRNFSGTIVANVSSNINSFQTVTASTHANVLYASDVGLGTGVVNQGVVGIAATSQNIVCTAQVIDASAAVPNGIDLHPTRFNPIPGSQE